MITVTEDVCFAVLAELERKGISYLVEGFDILAKEQPALTVTLTAYLGRFVETHGKLAGESMLRLLVVQYKLLKAQFEVNELEEQGKL